MKTAMYLNIPNTTVVNHKNDAVVKELSDADLCTELLKYWKRSVRCSAKEKEKVAELERALRETVSLDMAEAFVDRYRESRELTQDFFQ